MTYQVWIVAVIIYYASGNEDLGEEWVIPNSLFILGGFLVMMVGIYIYYGGIKWFKAPPEEGALDDEDLPVTPRTSTCTEALTIANSSINGLSARFIQGIADEDEEWESIADEDEEWEKLEKGGSAPVHKASNAKAGRPSQLKKEHSSTLRGIQKQNSSACAA